MAIVLKFYFEFDHASKTTLIYTAEGVLWGHAEYDNSNDSRTLIYQGSTLKMYFTHNPSQKKTLIYEANGTPWGEAVYDNSTKLTMIHKDGAVVGWTEHKPKPMGQKEGEVYLDEALFLVNLIENGGFETGTDAGWEQVNSPPTWEVQSAIKRSGNYALKVGDGYGKGAATNFELVAGKNYSFKFHFYIGSISIPFGIYWWLNNGAGNLETEGTFYGTYEEWIERGYDWTEGPGGAGGRFGINLEEFEGSNFFVLDDVTLYEVA